MTPNPLPDSLDRQTVIEAIRLVDSGIEHRFADSTGYDIVYEGRRYPPEAIVGVAAKLATGRDDGPEDFSGGLRSKCFRLLEDAGFEIVPKVPPGAWLLQGNPARYDIDSYVLMQDFLYWSVPRQHREMRLGDQCVLWRSGADAGALAVGRIAELPCTKELVAHPHLLGEQFWRDAPDDADTMKVGIEITDRRPEPEDGFVSRDVFQADPVLRQSLIIRMPSGTVFKLTGEELAAFSRYWGAAIDPRPDVEPQGEEGRQVLRHHYSRERNRSLVKRKRSEFASRHDGRVFCEICRFEFGSIYPEELGDGFIEVHHVEPLSRATTLRLTTLDDLLLVCANCHRMIHRTQDVERNLGLLRRHFDQAAP